MAICWSEGKAAKWSARYRARSFCITCRHVMQNERARYLADHLAALPSDQQMAMELHHLAGYSISEIAERMAKSKASVAGLLRRGLEQLREDLKHKEKELR